MAQWAAYLQLELQIMLQIARPQQLEQSVEQKVSDGILEFGFFPPIFTTLLTSMPARSPSGLCASVTVTVSRSLFLVCADRSSSLLSHLRDPIRLSLPRPDFVRTTATVAWTVGDVGRVILCGLSVSRKAFLLA